MASTGASIGGGTVVGQKALSGDNYVTYDIIYKPAVKRGLLSVTLLVCNRATVNIKFRAALVRDNDTPTAENYIYYDLLIPANYTFNLDITGGYGYPYSLIATSNVAGLSVTLFGVIVVDRT
jgi:hypothetical protein